MCKRRGSFSALRMTNNMNKDISQKVLDRIKDKKIEPKAKWQFLLKDSIIWVLFGLSIFIGALATAAAIFNIKFSDWDIYDRAPGGRFSFLLEVMPYFWLVILILLVVVAYYNFKHTKKGYKYNFVGIILLSLVASLVLGGASYGLGLGEKMEYRATRHLPFYKGLEDRRMQMWKKDPEGLLAGKIIKVYEERFDLEDLKNKLWEVETENTEIMPMVILQEGEMIRMIGKRQDGQIFVAERIMPWERPGMPGKNERKNRQMRINY